MVIWQDSWLELASDYRLLHIFVPDWYFYSAERLPVTYFFDGQNLFLDEHSSFGRSWHLEHFLCRWEKPMIVVGLESTEDGERRKSEYNPYNRLIEGTFYEGWGDQTFRWLIEGVKPYIDSNFRTWSHREATGLVGAGLGGLMALYGGIHHNDVFGKCAAMSSGMRHYQRHMLEELRHSSVASDTRVYLGWGEQEAGRTSEEHDGFDPARDTAEARASAKVAAALEERGAACYLYYQEGGQHRAADWDRQIPRLMDFLWRDHRWDDA